MLAVELVVVVPDPAPESVRVTPDSGLPPSVTVPEIACEAGVAVAAKLFAVESAPASVTPRFVGVKVYPLRLGVTV